MDVDSGSSHSSGDESVTSVEDLPQSKSLPSNSAPEDLRLPLDQYLPLGCFSYWEDHNSASTWVEATEVLPDVTDASIPRNALVDLLRAHWVRILTSSSTINASRRIWRVYMLPNDVARRTIDRSSQKLRKALTSVLQSVNVDPGAWQGMWDAGSIQPFDIWASGESCSLFYLFNTLPSPAPSVEAVKDDYAQEAMHELLDGTLRGLKTALYPYQRRSAAMMLQREVAPLMQLDPRLETRTSPAGDTFYYGARDRIFFREPRSYDGVKGGILAETMGLGKTLLCIALVLATKDHWPKPPPLYADLRVPVRPHVGSLVEMAAGALSRQGLPWRKVFDDMSAREGLEMTKCVEAMEKQVPVYEIPPRLIRSNRSSTVSCPPEKVRMSSGTIIVVPKNLMHQWQDELSKHVEEGVLKVLVMESPQVMLPPPLELATFDIVLFSRSRFENEATDVWNRYESPLKSIHWLRIIIDEGHSLSSTNTNAALVAENVVRAERRWVVSGTPARDLLGVEVDLEAMTYEGNSEDAKIVRRAFLEQRKPFNRQQESSSGAIKSLGSLASHFLKAEPWAVSGDAARWDDYIFRHEDYVTRTYTSFSTSLRRTLENLVIKTQPEDVERDIELPALSHKIIRLQPSFYDKLTANLFVLLFTSNAVTSERTDVDYLFHKVSNRHLHRLTANLRQSGFFWTGFDVASVTATIGVTERYLAKTDTACSEEDRQLLLDTVDAAKSALASPGWRALSHTQEMGLFLENWPASAAEAWAFDGCTDPMLMGLTQAVQAQKYINSNLDESEPAKGLADAGSEAKAALADAEVEMATSRVATESTKMLKQGVPTSSFYTENTKKLSASGAAKSPEAKRGTKRRRTTVNTSIDLAHDTLLGSTSITGSTSSKFSYLLDRVQTLHTTEKILIFFDANHQAFYISQALDLLAIKHLIYANTLSGSQRGKYIVLFNTDPGHRVLLMDIKQAAHGLNLSSASRVFFVNPVCSPGVEAQAIKRAHRIGQEKAVQVETLVLRGTVEEAMHDRAAKMTRGEHLKAGKFLEDDDSIARIIQQARVLPCSEGEGDGQRQIARLGTKQQLFGRIGRAGAAVGGLEEELFGAAAGGPREGVRGGEEEEVEGGERARKRKRGNAEPRRGGGARAERMSEEIRDLVRNSAGTEGEAAVAGEREVEEEVIAGGEEPRKRRRGDAGAARRRRGATTERISEDVRAPIRDSDTRTRVKVEDAERDESEEVQRAPKKRRGDPSRRGTGGGLRGRGGSRADVGLEGAEVEVKVEAEAGAAHGSIFGGGWGSGWR